MLTENISKNPRKLLDYSYFFKISDKNVLTFQYTKVCACNPARHDVLLAPVIECELSAQPSERYTYFRGPDFERGPLLSEILNSSIFEIEDMSEEQMSSMIDGTITDFDEGDLVTGTVVRIEHDEVLCDIGFRCEGVIPARELSIRKDCKPEDLVQLGDKIEAVVLQKEDKEDRPILSKRRAEYERAWKRIEEMFNAGQNVEGEVIEVVKGGLILDIGLRGFLPASLVDLRRVKDLQAFMGTHVEARIIEMDRNRNNVVLSRRVVLDESRKAERSKILEKLKKGMRLTGNVSSIVDFGAFVDLGGIDGLVHISELSWNHVNHPSEVVKQGQEVEVEVLDVDLSRERISLGLKQCMEDSWTAMIEKYPVNSIIEGEVTKLVSFGVFVSLGEGVEGLVHISELAAGHVEHPSQVVKVGDKVSVKIMEVNTERRRISLSMKAAAEALGIEIEIGPLPEGFKAKGAQKAEAKAEAEVESAEAPVEESVDETVEAADVAEQPAEEAVEA